MLLILIYGTDMCGNVYPTTLYVEDDVGAQIDKYMQLHPTVCHIRCDIALPMHDGNTLRRVR